MDVLTLILAIAVGALIMKVFFMEPQAAHQSPVQVIQAAPPPEPTPTTGDPPKPKEKHPTKSKRGVSFSEGVSSDAGPKDEETPSEKDTPRLLLKEFLPMPDLRTKKMMTLLPAQNQKSSRTIPPKEEGIDPHSEIRGKHRYCSRTERCPNSSPF